MAGMVLHAASSPSRFSLVVADSGVATAQQGPKFVVAPWAVGDLAGALDGGFLQQLGAWGADSCFEECDGTLVS